MLCEDFNDLLILMIDCASGWRFTRVVQQGDIGAVCQEDDEAPQLHRVRSIVSITRTTKSVTIEHLNHRMQWPAADVSKVVASTSLVGIGTGFQK